MVSKETTKIGSIILASLLLSSIFALGAVPIVSAVEERVYTVPVITEAKTWDPMVGYGSGSDTVSYNIYEGLLAIDRTEDGEWVFSSLLATSWSESEDHTEWTFGLREGVTFHDGTPFNSSAVVYWFERMDGVGRGPAWLYSMVIDSVEAVDTYTVKIRLTEAIPAFDFKCIMSNVFGAYGIMSPTYAQAHTTEEDPWAAEWMYDHTCGTGPYMVESVAHGDKSVWVKFPDYRGGWEGNHIDKVVFEVVGDPQVQMMQYLSGEVDAYGPTRDQIPGVFAEKEDSKLFVDREYLSVLYIFMNLEKEGPIQDVNVRRAISHAFDYQGVIDFVYNGYARSAKGPLPHGIPHFDDEVFQYTTDIEEAKNYMAKSAYAEGFSATIIAGPGTWEQIAEVFQRNMFEIGIDVSIQVVPYSVLWDLMADPETAPEFTIALWYPDYPTADVYLTPVFGPMETAWQNWAFYVNPEVNALLDEGRYEFDEDERAGIYSEVQAKIVEDVPVVFMLEEDRVTFLAPYVEGYERSPIHQGISYYKMSIEGKYPAELPPEEPPVTPPDEGPKTQNTTLYMAAAVIVILAGALIYTQMKK